MLASLCSIGLTACLLGAGGPVREGYLLGRPARSVTAWRHRAFPYRPHEGDLVFYDDRSPAWTALFTLAGTGPPLHMGIVVRKREGGFAILEAGPDDGVWVELLDLGPRLRQFHRDFPRGVIHIRRCKRELSAERSAALTTFALAQKGKRYAVGRLLLQGTSLRARGPLAPWLARTRLERDSWFCSELAVAAGTVAGLFDPRVVRANATYPRDLIDDSRHDLSASWHERAEWRPGVRIRRRGPQRRHGDRPAPRPGTMQEEPGRAS